MNKPSAAQEGTYGHGLERHCAYAELPVAGRLPLQGPASRCLRCVPTGDGGGCVAAALAAWLLMSVTLTAIAAIILLILEKCCKGFCRGSLGCAMCRAVCDAAGAVTCADGVGLAELHQTAAAINLTTA